MDVVTPQQIIFFVLATMTVLLAVAVIIGRNLFHAAAFLGAYLLHIAGFYFLLDAELVAMMQVFIYVGGVVVVLLFGIMLTSRMTDVRFVSAAEKPWLTIIEVVGLVGLLAFIISKTQFNEIFGAPVKNSAAVIGRLFMTDYVLPFEVISVLLLAALVGAIVMTMFHEEAKQ